MLKSNLAAIDLGSNSCRIQIADNNGKPLFRVGHSIKLGAGLVNNQYFAPEAIERGINCLTEFYDYMHNYNVGSYRAIATAACRMAKNSEQFVSLVKQKCGINLEIISPEEEALLTLKGAILNANPHKPYVLVFDLGGGSTEITLAANNSNPEILYTLSIPLGAHNGTELYNLTEYSEKNTTALSNEVKKYLRQFLNDTNFEAYHDKCCNIATSGTALRLVGMTMKMTSYEREKIDGYNVNTDKLDKQIFAIYNSNMNERNNHPFIGANRSPIFIAACTIFRTIYNELKLKEITASLKGAQEAIIQDLRKHDQTNCIGKICTRPQDARR